MQTAPYAAVAQLLLELKAKGFTTEQLAQALVLAAQEAGIRRYQFGEAYDNLRL